MKVNDYVRSSWGTISRIKKYKHDEDGTGFSILIENECIGAHYKSKSQFDNDYKTSPNIIDLIDVGDYVNGYLVKDIDYAFDDVVMNNKNARIVPYIDCNKDKYIDDIKSIVTHEQFSQMEYRIGE